MRLWTIIFLGIAANLDNLGIGLAYGLKNIKVPFRSNLFIAVLSGLATLLSISFGHFLSDFLPHKLANTFGGLIVSMIGVWTLIQQYFPQSQCKQVSAKTFWSKLGNLIKNPILADKDGSKTISINESILLGIALSLNCLSTGLGAGMTRINSIGLAISIMIFSLLTIYAGTQIADRYTSTSLENNVNLLTGLILIIIGIYEIIF